LAIKTFSRPSVKSFVKLFSVFFALFFKAQKTKKPAPPIQAVDSHSIASKNAFHRGKVDEQWSSRASRQAFFGNFLHQMDKQLFTIILGTTKEA